MCKWIFRARAPRSFPPSMSLTYPSSARERQSMKRDVPIIRLSDIAITGGLLLLLSMPPSSNAQVVTSFFVRSYAGKCVDFGPGPHAVGSPVFIFDCNHAATQQLR